MEKDTSWALPRGSSLNFYFISYWQCVAFIFSFSHYLSAAQRLKKNYEEEIFGRVAIMWILLVNMRVKKLYNVMLQYRGGIESFTKVNWSLSIVCYNNTSCACTEVVYLEFFKKYPFGLYFVDFKSTTII